MRVKNIKQKAYEKVKIEFYWYYYYLFGMDDQVKDGDAEEQYTRLYTTYMAFEEIGLITIEEINKAEEEAVNEIHSMRNNVSA